jgi:hypothetical protein
MGWQNRNTVLPWTIAGIASLAFLAFVVGQRFSSKPAASPSDSGAPEAPFAGGAGGGPAGSPLAGAQAPDISNMSSEEKRTRLYDRVMRYVQDGQRDSVALWAPMAIMAYRSLGPLDLDGQYDLGRLGEVSGDADLAASQADTVLKQEPHHLLGLALAAHAAGLRKDAAAERDYFKRFLAAEATEMPKNRPEYQVHAYDITQAEADARRIVPPTTSPR